MQQDAIDCATQVRIPLKVCVAESRPVSRAYSPTVIRVQIAAGRVSSKLQGCFYRRSASTGIGQTVGLGHTIRKALEKYNIEHLGHR